MQPRLVVPGTIVSVIAFALAGPCAASGVTGTAAITSDYVFRGLSQTNQDPAFQAGIEYAHDSGFYAGTWGSNVSWLSDLSSAAVPISNSVEIDLYAGYRGSFGDAVKFDVGAIHYAYPGDYPDGFNRPYTTELYVGVSVSVFSAKYFHAVTDLFGFADSENSGYLDLAANWEFAPSWVLNAHVGRQWVEENDAFDYTDWKLGVTRNFAQGWSLAAAYVDTNADEALYTNPFGNYLGDRTGVVTLTRAF
jgi:uncharacterized protein (TIGR02001 family)